MTDLELLHFEQLKSEVQAKYLENHTPSVSDISKWKGIDIIYFQEDLRRVAKGNISEKSFYTYFKNTPVEKLPRIDMLNLLSAYVDYASWYDFKKNHALAEEILEMENDSIPTDSEIPNIQQEETKILPQAIPVKEDLLVATTDHNATNPDTEKSVQPTLSKAQNGLKKYLWIAVSAVLAVALGVLAFSDDLFIKTYKFHFVDADRSQPVQNSVEIKVYKEGESPLTYRVKANEPFVYQTKDKILKMVVSSIFYRKDSLVRNLENAPTEETIELKPNEYSMMLYSYSRSKDFKNRRAQLESLISDNAVIYQVFDNQYFNVETMTKQRYINFLSTPSTSLENLDVIETKVVNGKIVLIKFRIKKPENETNP